MNSNDSKPFNQPQPPNEPTLPATPSLPSPLASPDEPTRAHPSDPSRTYSSDPSQYAYPHKPVSSAKNYTTEPLDTARIAGNPKRSSENEKEKEGKTFEDKNRQSWWNQGNSNPRGDFYSYATSNKEQTIAYILLILGLLVLLFFNPLLGGLMIGMVAGYFFSSEIVYYIRNLNQVIGSQNHLRYIVFTALLLGLFIAAPGIFIGAIIVATFKQVMMGSPGP